MRHFGKFTLALFSLSLVLALHGCAAHKPIAPPPPADLDHSITMKWNQSFANNGACSGSVTTSCISGFNEGYLNGTTPVQLHNDVASVCTGSTQPEACTSTFNGVLPIGNIVFYVATTYVDQNGAAGVTAAANSAGTPVASDAAQNVTVTVQ